MPLQCRLATIVGWHGEYGVFWPGCASGREHVARRDVGPVEQGARLALDVPEATGWQEPCRDCGAADIPWDGDVKRFSSTRPVYDTEDGQAHPGDMFWTEHANAAWCTGKWTNCDGRHLHVVLPNGHHWDVDSRASNCTMSDDTTHRCWVREGEPPNVTAGKAGHTCTAGAGSILSGDYHGFLQAGILT